MNLKAEELRRKHPRFVYQSFESGRAGNDLENQLSLQARARHRLHPEIVIESIDRSRIDSLMRRRSGAAGVSSGADRDAELLEDRLPRGSRDRGGRAGPVADPMVERAVAARDGRILLCESDRFQEPRLSEDFRAYAGARRQLANRAVATSRRGAVWCMVSGGKDSALTVHEMRAAGEDFNCLMLNPPPSAVEVAAIAGCTAPITVRRTLDPRMLDLNRQGYLNGHTPFSALLAILGLTCAALFDYDRVVVSNERSSDEGNVAVPGRRDQPSVFQDLRVRDRDTRVRARLSGAGSELLQHPAAAV